MMITLFFLIGLATAYYRRKKIRLKSKNGKLICNMFKNCKFLILLILMGIFLISFAKVHYLITEIIFFIICYLAYSVSNEFSLDIDRDLLFLAWFMTFFIFQSVYIAKDHRYFITMVAPLAYFLTRGLTWSVEELKVKFREYNLTLILLTILLLSTMILSVASQIPDIEKDNYNSKLFNQEAQNASYWLMNYDPEYKSKLIYADLWSYFGWFLQTDVGKMPIFRNNQTIYAGTKDYNFTEDDKMAFDRELNKTNPDYYFGVWSMNFTNYEPINRFGQVTIYQRK
ncbi:hypothetical protein [Methanobacterium subterraneum]|uniref:hypothetical protein n=1 Tax=Methanobacterium subterraneum TaxID=59277 RepID=UPI0013000DC8|nr:hypothetical protein [Methanobacterium subterraneum]